MTSASTGATGSTAPSGSSAAARRRGRERERVGDRPGADLLDGVGLGSTGGGVSTRRPQAASVRTVTADGERADDRARARGRA